MQTIADFGAITINGVTTYLGSVQAPFMTSPKAAEFVVGALNANSANTVTASVDDSGRLTLTSKDGTSPITIDRVGITTTGDESRLVDQVYRAVTSGTSSAIVFAPASYSMTTISAATTTSSLTSQLMTSTGEGATIASSTSATASGTSATLMQTDFGKLTINGREFFLGSVQTAQMTPESAAQYLAGVITAQGSGLLAATADGSRLTLSAVNRMGSLIIEALGPSSDLIDGQNRLGFTGFTLGQSARGSLTGAEIVL